jgi:chromosome segregation ATPase
LFAIGLGALGIGGAVAIHLSLSLNNFETKMEALRKEIEHLDESVKKEIENLEESMLTALETATSFDEKLGELEVDVKKLEAKSEELAMSQKETCQKVNRFKKAKKKIMSFIVRVKI